MGKYDLFLRGIDARSIVDPTKQTESSPSQEVRTGPSFDEILAAQLPMGTVKLTTDAQTALKAVGIELTPLELERIGQGIDAMSSAGGHKGLLVGEKVAVVVDVGDRTITAAAARKEARDHVFSEIDSVMLLD
jgi:flagellar operon protein